MLFIEVLNPVLLGRLLARQENDYGYSEKNLWWPIYLDQLFWKTRRLLCLALIHWLLRYDWTFGLRLVVGLLRRASLHTTSSKTMFVYSYSENFL